MFSTKYKLANCVALDMMKSYWEGLCHLIRILTLKLLINLDTKFRETTSAVFFSPNGRFMG